MLQRQRVNKRLHPDRWATPRPLDRVGAGPCHSSPYSLFDKYRPRAVSNLCEDSDDVGFLREYDRYRTVPLRGVSRPVASRAVVRSPLGDWRVGRCLVYPTRVVSSIRLPGKKQVQCDQFHSVSRSGSITLRWPRQTPQTARPVARGLSHSPRRMRSHARLLLRFLHLEVDKHSIQPTQGYLHSGVSRLHP